MSRIIILIKRFHAYYDKDSKEFGYEPRYNQARHFDSVFTVNENDSPKDRMAFFDFHRGLPEDKHYHYLELGFIPYEYILEVDETGDEYFEHPHVYVQRSPLGKTERIVRGRAYSPGSSALLGRGCPPFFSLLFLICEFPLHRRPTLQLVDSFATRPQSVPHLGRVAHQNYRQIRKVPHPLGVCF